MYHPGGWIANCYTLNEKYVVYKVFVTGVGTVRKRIYI